MGKTNPPDSRVEMIDNERRRIFVTMQATFKDEDRCRRAMEKIVSDAHAADGVDSHFWFRSKDGSSLFVVEQYADSDALRKAVMRFTSARISFFRSISVTEVSVYGETSRLIKAMFAPLRPKYMGYVEGYSKTAAQTDEAGIKDFERSRVFVATNAIVTDEAKYQDAIRTLAESAHAETGTHSHFWTRSSDGTSLFAIEQFADEGALIDHLLANPTSRPDRLESLEVRDVTIYGAESDETTEIFADIRPTYMNYYGGYSK